MKYAVLFLLIGFLFSGCATLLVAGGATAGVFFAKGDLVSVEEVSYSKTWSATKMALNELNYLVISETGKQDKGVIKSRRGDDKLITITIYRQTETTTKISIRVGTFGNEPDSMMILDMIRAKM